MDRRHCIARLGALDDGNEPERAAARVPRIGGVSGAEQLRT